MNDARSASYERTREKPNVARLLTVVRANHAALCREIVPSSFATGVLAEKMTVIFVPQALESTVN